MVFKYNKIKLIYEYAFMERKVIFNISRSAVSRKIKCDIILDGKNVFPNPMCVVKSVRVAQGDLLVTTNAGEEIVKCEGAKRELWICDKRVDTKFNDQIIGFALSKQFIFVTIDHPRLNDPKYFPFDVTEPCESGNEFAMDLKGNIVWRFEDMVDTFMYPSIGGDMLEKSDYRVVSLEYDTHLNYLHEYYSVRSTADEYYLFDVTTMTYLGKRGIRN